MASFSAFNTLQQKQLFSINPCKCPHYLLSHIFTLKHKSHQQYPHFYTSKPSFCNKSNTSIQNNHPNQRVNSSLNIQLNYGFSSFESKEQRVGSRVNSSSVVEEKIEKKYTREGYVRKDVESVESGKKRKLGSVVSSLRSKEAKSKRSDENKVKLSSNKSDNEVEEGKKKRKKTRREKKTKLEVPEAKVRVGLDMCSKRGDFLGAIAIYDSAQKEGLSLGQYQYAVLLYLCSSAAVGVVRPAKSGSGSRSLDKLDVINGKARVNFMDMSKTEEKNNGKGHNSSTLETRISREFEPTSNDGFDHKGDKSTDTNNQISKGYVTLGNEENDSFGESEATGNKADRKIQVSEDVKKYALMRGFEIYDKMCSEKIPLNEATLTSVARMAMAMGDGNMALEMVNKMKEMGINPRLRSYGPALFTFCNSGDVEKAFMVEEHMLENGVYPEEPELEALLKLSVDATRNDKVYYLLHKLRKSVRKVSPSTADLIERWFRSKSASRIGKRKWDQRLITEAMENGGGGWHGQGWLGSGRWSTARALIGSDGVCESCGDKLVTIDLDPVETENFAESVATIASKRERDSSFQTFQKWLDYYGPFEAVVDAANVGLFGQRKFSASKVNAIVNGIRQKLPSKKWPLIVLHNRRTTGGKMEEPANKTLIEKWKNADALYATPTGSNDDWYWLYAAIKCKGLLVTNDEMRDHIFQLLGNDFFPRWKERHQVHFSFGDAGPEFYMPPPCSVVIQESEKGHWHIPIAFEDGSERERTWLCVTRTNPNKRQSPTRNKDAVNTDIRSRREMNPGNHGGNSEVQKRKHLKGIYSDLKSILSESASSNSHNLVTDINDNLVTEIETAEKKGGCIIDFQI